MTQHKLIAANYNDGALWVYERLEAWLASHDIAFELAMCRTEEEIIERAQGCDMYLAFSIPRDAPCPPEPAGPQATDVVWQWIRSY